MQPVCNIKACPFAPDNHNKDQTNLILALDNLKIGTDKIKMPPQFINRSLYRHGFEFVSISSDNSICSVT